MTGVRHPNPRLQGVELCSATTYATALPPLRTDGLCNAVMAAVPGARFVRHWLSLYASFRSRGRDVLWDEHSVLLPARLATSCSSFRGGGDALTILQPKRFFPFYWDEARSVVLGHSRRRVRTLRESSYVVHLWARGASYGGEGGQLGPARLADACGAQMRKSVYGELACPFLDD